MLSGLIVLLAYTCYFVYDYNSIKWRNKFAKCLFTLASAMILSVSAYELIKNFVGISIFTVVAACVATVFLVLLIYTLFFALPFDSTYVRDSREREAYTGGVYSLCRHPGVLWLAGLYLSLMPVVSGVRPRSIFLLIIVGDIVYVIYQDVYIFPKTFTNYNEYKKTTPFLLPGRHKGEK